MLSKILRVSRVKKEQLSDLKRVKKAKGKENTGGLEADGTPLLTVQVDLAKFLNFHES